MIKAKKKIKQYLNWNEKNATVKEYQTMHDILDQGLSWKNLPHC